MVRKSVPVNIFGMEYRMFSIGARVKEERERLGMTIPEFADAAGAKKNTVIDWQKDLSSPPAAKLQALASVGVDIQYVVIGVRSSALMGDEELLLKGFRQMDSETKRRTLAMVYGGTPPAAAPPRSSYTFDNAGANINNQMGENHAPINIDMRKGKK